MSALKLMILAVAQFLMSLSIGSPSAVVVYAGAYRRRRPHRGW